MTNLLLTGAGISKASLADAVKHGEEYAEGTRTIKDDINAAKSKTKNTLKYIAKDTFVGAAIGTVGYAASKRLIFDTELPKFAQKAISKIKDVPFVKYLAESVSDLAPAVLNVIGQGAKKHPLVFAGLSVLSAVSTFVGLKHVYDLGKDNGKVDQKYDDIVEIRKSQQESNPLIKE